MLRGDTELTRPARPQPELRAAVATATSAIPTPSRSSNKRQTGQRLQLAVEGLPAATLGFVGAGIEGAGPATRLIVHPDAVGTFRVFLTVPANAAPAGSSAIEFADPRRERPAKGVA